MKPLKAKEVVLINKFQSLLRSGMDYDVESMYKEAAEVVYLSWYRARFIINRHYRGLISDEMFNYTQSLDCPHKQKVVLFSEKFGTCIRESDLLIRYIREGKHEKEIVDK